MLDLTAITKQVDSLLDENKGQEAENLMKESIVQAVREEDDSALLSLLNELIGYYRETSQREASYQLADQAKLLMDRMGLEGTIPYATTLLNIANAYRAGGRLSDSMDHYQEVVEIYRKLLAPDDMLVASLHNNISLLYQEMGDFERAKEHLLSALPVVERKPEAYFELAVTYSNLAATCLRLNQDEEAAGYFRKAIAIFEEHGVREAHYSAAVSALGTYYFKKGEFEKAAESFRKAMDCVRRSLGENEHYHRLKENLEICLKQMKNGEEVSQEEEDSEKEGGSEESFQSGLSLCRAYYEEYGSPMIRERFPEYADRIAAGLVGEGSDCFGYDDEFSRDHDWGPGFCLWVTQETWEQIGEALQEAYEQLPKEYRGYVRTVSLQGKDRRGVQTINGFYSRLLGEKDWETLGRPLAEGKKSGNDSEKGSGENSGEKMGKKSEAVSGKMLEDGDWKQMSDSALAACVNGEVFCDGEGIFSAVREELRRGYPEHILFLKLAESAARFSQTGQYNYSRMEKRGDAVTAQMMLGDCLREAMKLCLYMENSYPPHDKWLYKAASGLAGYERAQALLLEIAAVGKERQEDAGQRESGQMGTQVEAAGQKKSPQKRVGQMGTGEETAGQKEIRQKPGIPELVEQLAGFLTAKLYEKGYISDTEPYLDAHTEELLMKAQFARKRDKELVEDIAKLEFEAFDKVRNVGGRADCQNDWYTFNIMRQSQYLTWNRTMLLQYLYDFHRELARGHNLITEKYGRMMESTAPEEYEALKEHFPELGEEKKAIIEAIVSLQVGWMEEFEAHYPTLAGNARSVHTSDDNLYNTSYETYLRGELGTYSDKMLELYGRYVVDHAREGKNLTYEIMTNSVKMYGYPDLQKAEEEMSRFQT